MSQVPNGRDILLSQIFLIRRFALEFGQTLGVVIEQKVFGFRLEQAKRAWTVRSISSKLGLCQRADST